MIIAAFFLWELSRRELVFKGIIIFTLLPKHLSQQAYRLARFLGEIELLEITWNSSIQF